MTASYDLASTTAMILAGGLGTRLRSVISDRPKVLAPVCGRPFLSYLLDQVGAAGIRRVVLCTGHRGEQIEALYGDAYDGLKLVHSRETTPAGTGGALRIARGHVDSSSILVLNGDSYCAADLRGLWDWHHVQPAHVSVVTAEVEDASSFGRVETDSAGRVVRFAEKTPDPTPGPINAGIYLMHTALLGRIPADRAVSLETELFPRWVNAGGVFAYATRARFLDIGTPERFGTAETFLESLHGPVRRPAIEEVASALASVQGDLR